MSAAPSDSSVTGTAQKRGRQDDNEESDAKRARGSDSSLNAAPLKPEDSETTKADSGSNEVKDDTTAAKGESSNVETNGELETVKVHPDTKFTAEIKPIESTAGDSTVSTKNPPPHTGQSFFLRTKYTTRETSIIIGKNGTNIGRIREISNAHITVSPYQKGVAERIVTVSGSVHSDAVVSAEPLRSIPHTCLSLSQAIGCIARAITNEPIDGSGTGPEASVTLLVPECLTFALLGYPNNENMHRIQSGTGAQLHLASMNLPYSSERACVITANPSQIQAAVREIADTLSKEILNRYGDIGMSNYAARDGAPLAATHVPGGLIATPYWPRAINGAWGNSREVKRGSYPGPHAPSVPTYPQQAYSGNPQQAAAAYQPQPGQDMSAAHAQYPQYAAYGAGYGAAHYDPSQYQMQAAGANPYPQYPAAGMVRPGLGAAGTATQQIYIPNDMVGAVIGKGGHKINEIRTQSNASIKISEPSEGRSDRLVTISGTPTQNQLALHLLQQRINDEKTRS